MLIRQAFNGGVADGLQKFALAPPSKADSFVSKVDEGKDSPPPPGMEPQGPEGEEPPPGGDPTAGLPPEIVELLTQALAHGGSEAVPPGAPPPGGEGGGIPPELAAALSQSLSGGPGGG